MAGSILTGIIALWSGTADNIPSGWALCDGNNGTPDLRDRFVLGAAGSVAPGGTGGNFSHTHEVVESAMQPYLDAGDYIANSYPDGSWADSAEYHAHPHQCETVSHIPSYYALCYIMHL